MSRLIGEELRSRGVLDRRTLADALVEQRRVGGYLGRILVARGSITRRALYDGLAAVWTLRFVDLIAAPPDDDLMAIADADEMLGNRWVPLQREHREHADVLVVAVAIQPTGAIEEQVRSRFACDDIEFVVTTDWDIERAVLASCREPVVEKIAYGLASARPELSARRDHDRGWFPRWAMVIPVALGIAVIVSPLDTLLVALIALNILFLVLVLFKVGACIVGSFVDIERMKAEADHVPSRIPDTRLPTYTILVPAYHVAKVVSKVIEHLSELDYPNSKLQVIVLLEFDDEETIAAAKAAQPPDWVRFYVVPAGGPQTKPRACNLGLALAQGEYLTIYDAEDRPQPDQLRAAIAAFADADPDTVCMQARLNYFNSRENILTRMFTLEYSAWFDAMLPGLDHWRVPLPLGGTSNHFRTAALRDLGGWDPYNVTEDADLGIRASAEGLRIGTIPSTTWEEGCSEWQSWIRQRTRWIKGYMVTSFVHLRKARRLAEELGVRGILGFLALVLGTPLTFLVYPIVVGFWLFTFLGGHVPGLHLPAWVGPASFVNLVLANISMMVVSAVAVWRRRARDLVPFVLLNPFYWVLHSVAAWRALVQLVRSPFYWEKTPHGIVHGPNGNHAHADLPAVVPGYSEV